ncbi:MAG: hypothetical protein R3C03_22620 [Pirellulaceae bacterium]
MIRIRSSIAVLLLISLAVLSFCLPLSAQEDVLPPSVGTSGYLHDLILPGTELIGRPLDDRAIPLVVRVLNTIRHGDSFRYEIQYIGMEPGEFNLADYLIRKDGSSTEGLPKIPVSIRTMLPPGQVEPNELGTHPLSRIGGYRVLSIAAAAFWVTVLAFMIFWRKGNTATLSVTTKPMTFAEVLRDRLERARQGQLSRDGMAELERMLVEYWRRRLQIEDLSHADALKRIRSDEQSGPLFQQLESWLHNPHHSRDVSINKLLTPYEVGSLDEGTA